MGDLNEPFLTSISTDSHYEPKKDATACQAKRTAKRKATEIDELESREVDIELETSVLCARASAVASQRRDVKRAILTAPFIVLTMLVGLWPVSYKIPQKLFMILGIVLNTYTFIGNIAVYKFCGDIQSSAADQLSPWLCYRFIAHNQTRVLWAEIFGPVLFSSALFSFAQFSGYILIIQCVLKSLPGRKNAISLKSAFSLVTRNQWIKLNIQIVLSFIIWISILLFNLSHAKDYISSGNYVIWLQIENFIVWFYIGAPLWVFAVMIFALESLVIACFQEIKELREGSTDDVIRIYRELCKHVFSTVRGLKVWFVIHWFAFGIAFVVNVAVGFKWKMNGIFNENNGIFNENWLLVINIVFLAFSVYPFLYPSICAASLTSKCGNMLEEMNFLQSTEWHPDHPLRDRRNMNDFLIFANQTKCGFRIGKLTFNNGLAWVSAFFGVFGFVQTYMNTRKFDQGCIN